MDKDNNLLQTFLADNPAVAEINNLNHQFGMLCYKYFFQPDDVFDKSDIEEVFVDQGEDGGIDFINANVDSNTISLIQTKNIREIGTIDDIADIFTKMLRTYNVFTSTGPDETASYNSLLKRVYKSAIENCHKRKKIRKTEFHVFLGCENYKTPKKQHELSNYLESHLDIEEPNEYFLHFIDEIENQINITDGNIQYVDHNRTLRLFRDTKGNFWDKHVHSSDRGCVVSISSKSLRDLHDTVGGQGKGLYEQNLRFYVVDKEVDKGINRSISDGGEDFWFLNNGITIGCEDFNIDGDHIELEKFSIVNGCQTTSCIGKADPLTDFPILCKILKPNDEEKLEDFLRRVAIASNSQKPINTQDLKSNDHVQLKLKDAFLKNKPKYNLIIKRGQKRNKKKLGITVTNENIGKLIGGCLLQHVGLVRNTKAVIWNDDKSDEDALYYKIFSHDRGTQIKLLEQLLDISEMHKKWKSTAYYKEQDDETIIQIIKNGVQHFPAIITYIGKKLFFPSISYSSDKLHDDILKDPFLKEDLNQESYFGFCEEIVELIESAYFKARISRADLTVTNFFKGDDYYKNYILKKIDDNIFDKPKYEKMYLPVYLREIYIDDILPKVKS